MQMISTISVFICLIINMGQEPNLKLIVKTFVALGLILGLDNKFAASFPKEVKENARIVVVSK